MHRWISRARAAVVLAAAIGISACGDARLKKLSTGIEKDSVAIVMGTDEPYRTQTYQAAGKFWEIFLYAPANKAPEDSIAWRKLSPVVLADGQVTGWGWDYWEKEATTLNIPVPERD